jgi:hypothetical protein
LKQQLKHLKIKIMKKLYILILFFFPPIGSNQVLFYYLADPEHISLQTFELTGSEIIMAEEGFKPAGFHQYSCSATHLSGKFFICRLLAGNITYSVKLIRYKN